MPSPTKDSRIEVRLTSEQKANIEAAASIEGRSLSEFSTDALTTRADEVIARDRQLRVDARALEEFTRMLDRPACVVDGLADLLRRPSVFVD